MSCSQLLHDKALGPALHVGVVHKGAVQGDCRTWVRLCLQGQLQP
jgi:hypothetical protein